MMDRHKFLFRRQYILGPRHLTHLKSWKKLIITPSVCVTVHPDLQTEQAIHNGNSITLLGYILDPENPLSTNSEIIQTLIRQIRCADEIFEYIDRMGGRFVIILDHDRELRVFSDPAGLRQVFYTRDSSKPIWCASQPGIIAEELSVHFDEEIVQDFMESPFFKDNPEYWYPGNCSPYRGILHLLPNHYLDLKTGQSFRYWPKHQLKSVSIGECVRKSSQLLKGLIESADHRFDLALGLSAGMDSRVLLAATKDFSKRIVYFSQTGPHVTDKAMDVVVPARLLRKLRLTHTVIDCCSDMDNDFKRLFDRNVTTARVAKGLFIYGRYKCFAGKYVCMTGNVSEIARCAYGPPSSTEMTAETLAELEHMRSNSFAVRQTAKWLATAKPVAQQCDIDILDMFYWEQRIGNWAAMTFTEADIANETFAPYNCRRLLTTLLSVDEEYRFPPDYQLHTRLIEHMWPETLKLPINPPKLPCVADTVKSIGKDVLAKIHMYEKAESVYSLLKRDR